MNLVFLSCIPSLTPQRTKAVPHTLTRLTQLFDLHFFNQELTPTAGGGGHFLISQQVWPKFSYVLVTEVFSLELCYDDVSLSCKQ